MTWCTPYGDPVPAAAEVYVWWAHTDDLTDAHLALLDHRERERLARFERGDDRDRFTLGSAVVRSLVAELDGTVPAQVSVDRTCPRCGAQHGPVTTPGRTWRCSVSHSGPFAVAAVVAASSASLVGVDLETRCPADWPELLPKVLAPDEAPPEHESEFVTMWVRKEAVVKATGEGLSRPLSSVHVSGAADPPRFIDAASSLQLLDLDLRRLRPMRVGRHAAAALAVGADRLEVHWHRARI
jgi:4'-phosphopantetheinyl transferase